MVHLSYVIECFRRQRSTENGPVKIWSEQFLH